MRRLIVAGVVSLSLGGCVTATQDLVGALPPAGPGAAPPAALPASATSSGKSSVDILVMTTRDSDGDRQTADPSASYGSVVVDRTLRPRRWGTAETVYQISRPLALTSEAEFQSNLSGRLGTIFAPKDILLFVHGFNNTFEDVAPRVGRFVDDIRFDGVTVAFSWPAQGGAAGVAYYLYDHQSANFSRDELASLIAQLTRQTGAGRIHIVAHSLGSWLTMESLRQLSIAGDERTLRNITTIILISPDIDEDVFTKQMRRLAEHRTKFLVLASRDDWALRLSRRIAAGVNRVGQIVEFDYFRNLGIHFFDMSRLSGDLLNHFKATNPAVATQISNKMRQVE